MRTNKLQDGLFTLLAEREQTFSAAEIARIIEQGKAPCLVNMQSKRLY